MSYFAKSGLYCCLTLMLCLLPKSRVRADEKKETPEKGLANGLRVRTLVSPEEARKGGERRGVTQVAISPDSKLLATSSKDGAIRFWEVETGKPWRTIQTGQGWVCTIAFSPDGKHVASSSLNDKVVRLWDIKRGREVRQFNGNNYRSAEVAFSPDGSKLAAGSMDGFVRLWDVSTAKEVGVFKGTEYLRAIAYSHEGKYLAAAAGLREDVIHVWEVDSGKEIHKFEFRQSAHQSLAFSPDERYLASPVTFRGIKLVGLGSSPTREIERQGAKSCNSIRFSPDGRTLISGNGEGGIFCWEFLTGMKRLRIPFSRTAMNSVAYAPNGKFLAASDYEGATYIVDFHETPVQGVSLNQLEDLWTDLGSDDAEMAYRAVRKIAVSSENTLPFLRNRIAQNESLDRKRLNIHLTALEDRRFAVREKAYTELANYGKWAESHLREALKTVRSLDGRRTIERLLDRLTDRPLERDQLAILRAIESIEAIGSVEAQQFLNELKSGNMVELVDREAKASVNRMSKRRSHEP